MSDEIIVKRCDLALFIVQIFVAFFIIILCLINISLNIGDPNMWAYILSTSIGYLMPSPKLKKSCKTYIRPL